MSGKLKMTQSKSEYAFDKSQGFNRFLIENRTVDNCCGFVKDIISRSSSILDIGCGPGSITQGFAQLSPKAEVVGVDISDNQIQLATELAAPLSLPNLCFRQGNIFELPFADNSFELVYAQTVFVHIPEHEKALSEIKRVLKPKGIFASKEIISSYTYFTPPSELIRKCIKVINNGVILGGGDPDGGLLMHKKIIEAGFHNIKHTMSWEQSPNKTSDNEYFINLVSAIVYGELGNKAMLYGWMTEDEIKALEELCSELANDPNAMWALPFAESVAMKP